MISIAVLYLATAIKLTMAQSIIAYDCGQQYTNVTTFSLIDVGECRVPDKPNVKIEKTRIALIQLNDYSKVKVILCKVEVTRQISYCDDAWYRSSFSRDIESGRVSYIEPTTRMLCDQMHRTRTLAFRNSINIPGLRLNGTTTTPVQLAGHRGEKGTKCTNAPYIDPYGAWTEVIVDGYIKVTLENYYATVDLDNDQVILNTGTRCKLTDESCTDLYGGEVYWDAIPRDNCKEKYSRLYTGVVDKITDPARPDNPVFALEASIVFAFTIQGTTTACSNQLYRTDHPRILIYAGDRPELLEIPEGTAPENIDLLAYMNSKFIYVEKHLKVQMQNLYHDLLLQKCQLEKKVIRNALNLAQLQPDLFSMLITKKAGHMGLVSGETINLIKCVGVPVTYRKVDTCYQEMPVYKYGKPYFMTPRSHILLSTGTRTTCNALVPPMYFLGQKWFKLMPDAVEAPPPQILSPETKDSWRYIDPKNLAEAGIYIPSQLKKLKDYVMFPLERAAVLNTIARGMLGKNVTGEHYNPSYLFDGETLHKILKTTWEHFWGRFVAFGTLSSGILGIFVICRLIKFFIDTSLHAMALYSVYGFSIHIIGAVWDSLTQLLLHIGSEIRRQTETPIVETQEDAPSVQQRVTPTAPQEIASTTPNDVSRLEIDNIGPLYPLLGRRPVETESNGQRDSERNNN